MSSTRDSSARTPTARRSASRSRPVQRPGGPDNRFGSITGTDGAGLSGDWAQTGSPARAAGFPCKWAKMATVRRFQPLLVLLLAASCTSSAHQASQVTPTSVPVSLSVGTSLSTAVSTSAGGVGRDPAESATPAAGVCGLATGSVGSVHFPPDAVPQPRCLVIRHDQRLSITNDTDLSITVVLGSHFKATVAPHQTYTFAVAVGTYLDPGVHRLVFSPSSAADIWVDAVCKGPGAVDCSTP